MKKVYILKGLPASGKSTWAKNMVKKNPGCYKRINKDDLRAMLDGGRWSRDNEKMILHIRDMIILESLKSGKHVIVDDTNLHKKHQDRIESLVKGQASVEVVEFDVSVDECIERDLKRSNSVGEKVIRDMYEQYIKKDNLIMQDDTLPKAYIFDIDGTLAIKGERSPYDWSRVGEDLLNIPVYKCLQSLEYTYHIIICTGRDGICEKETKQWLHNNNIHFDDFYMRPEGNNEKDYVIKERMLEEIVKKYYVVGVFDDRKQVVDMWRSKGLTCFQVADHNF